MRVFFISLFLVFFLVGCASELPPQPPSPGASGIVGRAGGVAIPMSQMPSWAAPPKYIDITPTRAYIGESVTISVGDVYASDNFDYVYTTGYVFDNHVRYWEPIEAFAAGQTTGDWAEARAGFLLDLTSRRFEPGMQYLLFYACSKVSGEWDCNNGPGNTGKWMLVAFEILDDDESANVEDYIIDDDIEDYEFDDSEYDDGSYFASYENGEDVDVVITPYDDYDDLLDDVVETGVWTPDLGGVCGFYRTSGSKVIFWWASDGFKVEVITYGDSIGTGVISEYGDLYPSECDLDDDLEDEGIPFCGDGHQDDDEECDGNDDDDCPGQCNFDCTCAGSASGPVCGNNIRESGEECESGSDCSGDDVCIGCECSTPAGYCGDGSVQKPNDQVPPTIEQCEYPTIINRSTGVVIQSGDACQVGGQTGTCDEFCQCVVGSRPSSASFCGDNAIQYPNDFGQLEQCESDSDCSGTDYCANCICFRNTFVGSCGDGVIQPNEQCDFQAIPNGCPAGMGCSPNCACLAIGGGGGGGPPGGGAGGGGGADGGADGDGAGDSSLSDDGLVEDGTIDASGASDDGVEFNDDHTTAPIDDFSDSLGAVDSSYVGQAFRRPQEGVSEDMDQYLVFFLAALAILIITIVNFFELKN